MFKVIPKSLYIADAGYGKGSKYHDIVSRKGNVLFRFTPNLTKLCRDNKGQDTIDMEKELSAKKSIKKKLVDFTCFIHIGKGKYAPVRIIASRLPEDKLLLARRAQDADCPKKAS